MRALLTILVVLFPGLAAAGAWPREPGTVFLSFSHSQSGERDDLGGFPASDYTALYAEYGLTPRLTFGLDAGRGGDGTTTAYAFLRRSLGPADRPLKTAISLGAGRHAPPGAAEPLAVLGAHAGRGFETRLGPAWTNADLWLHYRTDTGDTVKKADLTLGLKPRDDRLLILQLQTGDYPGSDPYARLAPSFVQRITSNLWLESGAEIGLTDSSAGLKLGVWLEF